MVRTAAPAHPIFRFTSEIKEALFRLRRSPSVRIRMDDEELLQELYLSLCEAMPMTTAGAIETLRRCRNKINREIYDLRRATLYAPDIMERM